MEIFSIFGFARWEVNIVCMYPTMVLNPQQQRSARQKDILIYLGAEIHGQCHPDVLHIL